MKTTFQATILQKKRSNRQLQRHRFELKTKSRQHVCHHSGDSIPLGRATIPYCQSTPQQAEEHTLSNPRNPLLIPYILITACHIISYHDNRQDSALSALPSGPSSPKEINKKQFLPAACSSSGHRIPPPICRRYIHYLSPSLPGPFAIPLTLSPHTSHSSDLNSAP
jgi:hypothetical protein